MEVERVQAVASLSMLMDTIPSEFIRSEHERPGTTTFHGPVPELPAIDLSDQDQDNLVRLITKASEEFGIFQVVNHGIPVDIINKLQKVGREFFELPQEEKEAYATPPGAGHLEGYGTKLQKEIEGKKAWVDHLFNNIGPPSSINYNFWPKNPPSYRFDFLLIDFSHYQSQLRILTKTLSSCREANEEFAKCLRGVVDKLLMNLSLGLGLEGNELKEAVGGDGLEYLLKINHYPTCPRPDLALGLVAHTDMPAITVLVPNDVPGLQVFKDEHWFEAKYIPNALIIHIGDQIEILSNGKYKSVLHRTTVNKEKVRMSWPVFCSPPGEQVIGPLPQLVSDDNPAKYKTKKYKDYLYCKINKLPQ
ncbi:hypothetical protein HHK36_009010 [Tetracentron sinense]|uniref:Fe2OG dioxygenase domain-containing protein n=1 Tax=Tetracentron sinense TaxID=13715 RepID=A0A834ZEJ5_TETSI|nr:hypothetical protein HHK36_009010 [Tetracentron sinense]